MVHIFVIGNSFRLFRFGESFAGSELNEVEGADMPAKRKRQGSMTLSGGAGQPAEA